ncbi:MAG: M3 family oligoendopeptidase [Flavobacteriales bacterium]|nr:M3 family oligoendopeptidase [Flavobacteriales bacterium]
MESNLPIRKPRKFLSEDLNISGWEDVEKFYKDLSERSVDTPELLSKWISDRSEMDAVLEEDMAWRYIKMNIDTTDKSLAERFQVFVEQISPQDATYSNGYDKRLIASEFLKDLNTDYTIYLKTVRTGLDIFREQNIPLNTQLGLDSQEYGSISAAMSVEVEGEELTMQKAALILKDNDRSKREEVYHLMDKRRADDREALNKLFDKLIDLRNQVALNADYKNYRDYMFDEKCRFDYSVADCFDFHDSISKEIVPRLEKYDIERKEKLGIDSLKPWDTQVDISGKDPLKPFESGEEMLEKTITCFNQIDPYFGECISIMRDMGHLDLESKKGKAPGGFNYPLYEIGVPFIYMNSVGSVRDLVTIVHEGGHAIHSFLTRDLEITPFKSFPSEVAELASMSMELISMEHWDVFFSDADELKRAKKEQLIQVLGTLPWVATIDKFQHWIYENPKHTNSEREAYWLEIMTELGSAQIDWSGLESSKANLWQKQLHLYEVPFYYIEYGMAQLGAIAMWKNYKENPTKTLEQYKAGLSLGYTKSIGDIYKACGIEFSFKQDYIKSLAEFVISELDKLD